MTISTFLWSKLDIWDMQNWKVPNIVYGVAHLLQMPQTYGKIYKILSVHLQKPDVEHVLYVSLFDFFLPCTELMCVVLGSFRWVPPSKNHTMVELHQCLRSPCATDRLHSVHVCERERKSIPFCFVTLSSCVTEYSAGRGLMVKEFNGMLTLFHTTREAVSYIKRTLIAL